MAHLAISLLGPFQASLDAKPITDFKSRQVRALLAYLAMEAARPHSRSTLAALLWPNSPNRVALNNLRYALANLRRAIGDAQALPPFLHIQRDTLQFKLDSDHEVDVASFEHLLGGDPARADLRSLKQAIELCRGSFLDGFSLGESPAFDEWVLFKREWVNRQMSTALQRLALAFEEQGQREAAMQYAARQLALEPWHEETHRQLMRWLAQDGQRSAALAQYAACRRALAENLSLEPSAETTRLYTAIRDGQPVAGRESLSPSLLAWPAATPDASLPFVAREIELAQLERHLQTAMSGEGRVVFVTGDAGSGKTALAREFVRRAMQSHAAVLAASGNCDEQAGIGDPYHPFRQVLHMLTGDIEAYRASGWITNTHAQRLWAALPDIIQAMVKAGDDLIVHLTPAQALLLRLEAFAGRTEATRALHAQLQDQAREHAAWRANPEALTPSALFEQVHRALQGIAARYPLVLILDDLQWADTTSLSLLFYLARRLSGGRILIIGLYRPGDVAQGRQGERHPLEPIVYELQRQAGEILIDLNYDASGERDKGQAFVEALLDSRPNSLGPDFRDRLYQRTGGNALFAVELLNGMETRGDLTRDEAGRWREGAELNWEWLPARVEAVIAEQFARLPDELQETLEVASVQGEEFFAEVVAAVAHTSETETLKHLRALASRYQLIHAVGIERRGLAEVKAGSVRLSRYGFRHSLFRTFLYSRLDAVKRATLHESVGLALETISQRAAKADGSDIGPEAVSLAWHFEQAGLVDKAVDYVTLAGKRAYWLGANQESLALLNRGLALLPQRSARPSQDALAWMRRELALQLSLNAVYLGAHGWSTPEMARACTRAYELAQQLGEPKPISAVLPALAGLALGQGKSGESLRYGEQLIALAQQTQDAHSLVMGHWILGTARFSLADFELARYHLEQAVVLHRPDQHTELIAPTGVDVGASSLAWLSYILHVLGYPDRALGYGNRALALARRLDHPMTTGTVLFLICIFYTMRRQYVVAAEYSAQMLRLAAEKRLPQMEGWAAILEGWRLVEQGQVEPGIAQMSRGLDAWQAPGTLMGRPVLLALLAQAHLRAGQAEQSLRRLDEALNIVERDQIRSVESTLWRTRGEALLQSGRDEREREAAACFERAVEIARRQKARLLELEATMSLCRLWQAQGKIDKQEDARRQLADLYGWFTEGFDTPDLQEANALLHDSAPAAPR